MKPTFFKVVVSDGFRFAIKLLEDVVFFVADIVNSGQPVLDVVMSKPNRERQKLMREQNILKQVRSKINNLSTTQHQGERES